MKSNYIYPKRVEDPDSLKFSYVEELKVGDQLGKTGWYVKELHELPKKHWDKFLQLYSDMQVESSGISQEWAHWKLWSFLQDKLGLDPKKSWSFRLQAGDKILVFSRGYIDGHKPEDADPRDLLGALGLNGLGGGLGGKEPFEIEGIRAKGVVK